MIVSGASAGPKAGESPIGTSNLFGSAWAIPNSSRTKTQVNIRCIMADKKGDTWYPLLLVINLIIRALSYIFPAAFIHLGYLFFARFSGTIPFIMIWKVPGFARVLR